MTEDEAIQEALSKLRQEGLALKTLAPVEEEIFSGVLGVLYNRGKLEGIEDLRRALFLNKVQAT